MYRNYLRNERTYIMNAPPNLLLCSPTIKRLCYCFSGGLGSFTLAHVFKVSAFNPMPVHGKAMTREHWREACDKNRLRIIMFAWYLTEAATAIMLSLLLPHACRQCRRKGTAQARERERKTATGSLQQYSTQFMAGRGTWESASEGGAAGTWSA